MSSLYKENNFSTESLSASHATVQNNINKTSKANIHHLIKRIHVEKRRERRSVIALSFFVLSVILIYFFFQS
tara:strand:+ start:266 stop:481 length:216 start_codon:yes stop_codon:yes gene_type:complete